MRRGNIATQSFVPNDNDAVKYIPKEDDVRSQIEIALKNHFLFKALDKRSVGAIIDPMTRRLMAPGEVIIKQGEKGDTFYVIERGEVNVMVEGTKVGVIHGPAAFGELALMYNSPRAATIVCSDYGVLWVTDRMTFRRALALSSASSIQSRIEFLGKVPLLKDLQSFQISQIAAAMLRVTYEDGENVVVQGEDGSKFYIIEEGTVVVRQEKQGIVTEVAKLTSGHFFGERALLKDEPRDASCCAVNGDVTCLVLDREHFDQLLGPLAKLIEEMSKSREKAQPENKKKHGNRVEEDTVDDQILSEKHRRQKEKREKIDSLAQLEEDLVTTTLEEDVRILRTIGTGTFGRVKFIEHTATKRVMALKCLPKGHLVDSHQVENVHSEKKCLSELSHPFISKLYGTWQDENQVYMFLELVQGGELWSVMYQSDVLPRTRFGGFKENNARMYIAIVLTGFCHIHDYGYAYRDLKPENLLLDKDGYLKIVDFGFAKFLEKGKKTQTLCGTPEYLSPELVLSKGHDRAVDFWALGILTYELLCGGTPFADSDQSKIFMKIVHSQRCLQIPNGFPRDCKDLILKLLTPNPTLRLGVLRGGQEDVRGHRWFGGIDWKKLASKRYQAPYQPKIANVYDDRNFDEYDEDNEIEQYTGDQELFAGF